MNITEIKFSKTNVRRSYFLFPIHPPPVALFLIQTQIVQEMSPKVDTSNLTGFQSPLISIRMVDCFASKLRLMFLKRASFGEKTRLSNLTNGSAIYDNFRQSAVHYGLLLAVRPLLYQALFFSSYIMFLPYSPGVCNT